MTEAGAVHMPVSAGTISAQQRYCSNGTCSGGVHVHPIPETWLCPSRCALGKTRLTILQTHALSGQEYKTKSVEADDISIQILCSDPVTGEQLFGGNFRRIGN